MDNSPRYTKMWLADGRILCYRLEDTMIATIDAWSGDLTQELAAWQPGRPWRLMLDIRLGGNVVSTYALRGAPNVYRRRSFFVSEAMAVAWLLEQEDRASQS